MFLFGRLPVPEGTLARGGTLLTELAAAYPLIETGGYACLFPVPDEVLF